MSNQIDRWLTAYVDGELTPEEARTVESLLRDHPGLEVMLRRMQSDSARLKALPRQGLPAGFSNEVLAEIRRRNLSILRRRPFVVRYLVPAAAAAAILTVLGLATRHLWDNHARGPDLARTGQERPGPDVAIQPDVHREVREGWDRLMAGLPSVERVMETAAPYRELFAGLGDVLEDALREQTAQIVAAIRTSPEEAESAVEPPFSTPNILTFPAGKADPFKTLQVRLPLFLDVKSLDSSKLLERLREENVHHLDLPCIESWKALERFQTACRAAGVKVVLDAEATRRLTGKIPAAYLVYLENVAPETVSKLMQTLQAEDSAAERRQKGDGQFHSLMVQSLDEGGRERLAEILGVQPANVAPSRPAKPQAGAPAGVDTTKPISNETLKSLQKAAASRPNGKPESVAQAVVVVWHPRLRSTISKEVRDLLDAKKPTQADGINVVFLFRPSRG